jgi:hypothetical protein
MFSFDGIFVVIIDILSCFTDKHKKNGLKIPFYLLIAPAINLYTPTISTLSPGFTEFTS